MFRAIFEQSSNNLQSFNYSKEDRSKRSFQIYRKPRKEQYPSFTNSSPILVSRLTNYTINHVTDKMHPPIDYFRPFPRLTGNYTNNASREIIYKMEENSRMEGRWGRKERRASAATV